MQGRNCGKGVSQRRKNLRGRRFARRKQGANPDEKTRRIGAVRGVHQGRKKALPVPPARAKLQRRNPPSLRRLQLPADSRFRRPLPNRQGRRAENLRQTRLARPHCRRRKGNVVRRLGADRPPRERRGRLQRVGRQVPPDARAWAVGHLGDFRSVGRGGRKVQVRNSRRQQRRPFP